MKFQRLTSVLVFVLAGSLFLTASVASAGPKEDVAAATMKWAQTLGQNDPDKVVPLYATDGVLWGTLSPTVRADRAALRDYFVTAFKVLPGLKVTFGEQLIRVDLDLEGKGFATRRLIYRPDGTFDHVEEDVDGDGRFVVVSPPKKGGDGR